MKWIEGVKESVAQDTGPILPKAELHEFKGKGHFTFNDMNSLEFPKLLQIILQ